MALALHMIWLGHAPPLRAMQNLFHVLSLFESELDTKHKQSVNNQSCIPLLWLNQSAWSQIVSQQVMPTKICDRKTFRSDGWTVFKIFCEATINNAAGASNWAP